MPLTTSFTVPSPPIAQTTSVPASTASAASSVACPARSVGASSTVKPSAPQRLDDERHVAAKVTAARGRVVDRDHAAAGAHGVAAGRAAAGGRTRWTLRSAQRRHVRMIREAPARRSDGPRAAAPRAAHASGLSGQRRNARRRFGRASEAVDLPVTGDTAPAGLPGVNANS